LPSLRKMSIEDVPSVIKIIDSHDEDDAEEAERSYERNGVENQYVLVRNEQVVGVTGIQQAQGCENSYWLSWTYIDDEQCGNGYGRQMLNDIITELRSRGARKAFLKVSDYIDPEDGDIYAAARHLYKSLGFTTEVTLPDFYAEGETQYIMGLRLYDSISTPDIDDDDDSADGEQPASDIHLIDAPVKFNNLFEISETEGSFCFGWEIAGKKHFTAADVQIGLEAAKEQSARAAYVSFPSNFSVVSEPLFEAGFELIGSLTDYYENGIDELHFVHHFN